MKIKHIFSLAVLAVMTAACSSEDITQQQAASRIGQTLPFKATISNSAGTRGLAAPADDNSDITAAWEENEKIALVHSTLNNENKLIVDVMTVEEVATDGKSATIAGTATYIDDNDEVYLVYVGHNDNMTNFQGLLNTALEDNSDKPIEQIVDLVFEAMLAAGTQDGTMATISDNLDFRKGKSTLKLTNGWVTFGTDAPTLSSQFAIWKLSLSDGTNAINATKLEISCGIDPNIDTYTITPTSGTLSTFYVLLPEKSSTTYNFKVTTATSSYYYGKFDATLAAGKYYQSPLKMTSEPTLSDLNSALKTGAKVTINYIVGSTGYVAIFQKNSDDTFTLISNNSSTFSTRGGTVLVAVPTGAGTVVGDNIRLELIDGKLKLTVKTDNGTPLFAALINVANAETTVFNTNGAGIDATIRAINVDDKSVEMKNTEMASATIENSPISYVVKFIEGETWADVVERSQNLDVVEIKTTTDGYITVKLSKNMVVNALIETGDKQDNAETKYDEYFSSLFYLINKELDTRGMTRNDATTYIKSTAIVLSGKTYSLTTESPAIDEPSTLTIGD